MTRPRTGLGVLIRPAIYAAAAAATYLVFVLSTGGQRLDAAALGSSIFGIEEQLRLDGFGVVRMASIALAAVTTISLSIVALVQGRWHLVSVTALCSLAAFAIAVLLEPLLSRPELGVSSYEHNTWPSGHVASVCALALASLRLMPPEWQRRATPVWMAVALVTLASYASMTTFAHRPSDTIGAILIAGAVFALAPSGDGQLHSWGRGWIWLCAVALGAVALVSLALVMDFDNLRPVLALASLLSIFAVACWVLIPERTASGQSRSRRSSRPASS